MHAAATFALAAVVERHLGYRFALPTIAIATYVGTSRLHDNVHFLSDVVFGAAVGTAVGWTVVGRHGRTNYAFAPTPIPGGFAVMDQWRGDRTALASRRLAHSADLRVRRARGGGELDCAGGTVKRGCVQWS